MSTLAELRTEVLFNTFDSAKYGTRATAQLNNAARDLASRSQWGAVDQVVDVSADGLASLGAPSGFSAITAVFTVSSSGARARWLGHVGDVGQPGTIGAGQIADDAFPVASFATVVGVGGELSVKPLPRVDRVWVTGYRMPARMAYDEDVCELGPDADEALIVYAKAKLSSREEDPEAYASRMQEYAIEARRFMALSRPVVQGPRVTPGTWGEDTFGVQ